MKVKSVELQSAISVHGTKAVGTITLNAERYPGIKMEYLSDGLFIEYGKVKAMTPLANVKSVILADKVVEKKD